MVFDKLSEKYVTTKPTSADVMLDDIVDIFDALCDEGICTPVNKTVARNEFFMTIKTGGRQVNLPKDFHPVLKNTIDGMNSVIQEIDELNLDETIASLTAMKEEIEYTEDIHEGYKASTLVGLSVAIESTKLWHSAHFDEEHPLHYGMKLAQEKNSPSESTALVPGDRKLQGFFDQLVRIITTDVNAALNFTITPIMQNPLYLSLLPGMLLWVGPISSLASLGAFFIATDNGEFTWNWQDVVDTDNYFVTGNEEGK